jgi:DNA polymerase
MTPVKRATPTARLPLASAADDNPLRRSFVSEHGVSPLSLGEREAALRDVANAVSSCKLCGLCQGRTNAVPGEGSPRARVMFVGEGPGATEDAQGRPFVGRAGQLLTKIVENGMGLRREDVFIANIVKCRPPENRDPLPEEAAACVPYLFRQIEIVDPEVLIPLGRHSMRELAGVSERDTIGRVRGKVYRVAGRAVIPTYHPAYLLRNPPEKVKVWHDIQLAMKELGLPIPKSAAGPGPG